MSDLYADLFATFEWLEKEAARKAKENDPGPSHPKLTDPHPQQADPTNPQSHPPQPQRTQPPAEPSPDDSLSPDSCLVSPDSSVPPTSCLSNEPAAPPPEPDPTSHTPRATSASEARQAASRENGRKSHGPKTAEGKARSSMNALKHGLTARQVCVGLEKEEEWDDFREEARRLLAPVGIIELEYADEWAAARWRLRRAYGIETLLFDCELADQEGEPRKYKVMDNVARIGLAFKSAKEDINALGRYATRIHRAGEHAHKMLLQLQRARQAANEQNEPEPKSRQPLGRNITCSAGSYPAGPGSQPGPLPIDRQSPSTSPSAPNCQDDPNAPIPIHTVADEPVPVAPAAPPASQNEPSALPKARIAIPTVPDEPNPTCSAGSHPAGPGSQPGPLPNDRQTQSAGLSGPNCQNEPSATIPAVPDEPAPHAAEPAPDPQYRPKIRQKSAL